MTSKEALNELIDEIKFTHNDGKSLTDYDAKLVEVIEKDLDMLELIKSKLKIDCFGRVHFICDELVEKDGILVNYDEWKIKAWLLGKELNNDINLH